MLRHGSTELLVARVRDGHLGLREVHAKWDRRGDVRRGRVGVQRDLRQRPDRVVSIFHLGLVALRLGALDEADAVVLRVAPHEPGLKLVCGHRLLILLGLVGVPHDSPTTRPHREGCKSGTAFVQGLQRLQSGHSGKAHWRPTRLDTRLRSAGVRGTLTSGRQAEKRQRFPRPSPAREIKGNAPDGAKRQRGHDHFRQTTTTTTTTTMTMSP